MRDYGLRFALIIIVITGYFFILRPARAVINERIFHPAAETVVSQHPELNFKGDGNSVTNHILISQGNQLDEIYFTVPFGLHFLLSLTGLLAIQAKSRYFYILILIQFATGALSLLFFMMTNLIGLQMISLTDFLIRYMNPLCSLGLVPLAFTLKKQAADERRT